MTAESLSLIDRLDSLAPQQANALIKAARSYQDAIWIGEWEPERAWVLLVSAVEALVDFGVTLGATDAELLKKYNPEIATPIEELGGAQLLDKLAPRLRMLFGSARKFCDFIMAHFPDPPLVRPPAGFQIEWSTQAIEPMIRKIYDHRSRALHDGTPFPLPMCKPPIKGAEDWQAPGEMPFGLAASSRQGTWLREDTPMHLHIFAHIVRTAIIKWWTANTMGQTDGR